MVLWQLVDALWATSCIVKVNETLIAAVFAEITEIMTNYLLLVVYLAQGAKITL